MSKYSSVISFIRDLYQEPTGFIPLHAPVFRGNEKKYVTETIDSSFVSSVGAFVDRFEKDIAAFTGAKFAIATVNGTAALHLALHLCDVGPDDLVITQPLTFIATCNAITYTGASPIFVDVDLDTLGMSPDALNRFLQEQTYLDNQGVCRHNKTKKRIKACVPMHTFGLALKIKEIAKICIAHNIDLIEDAAESLGTTIDCQHTGLFGKMGTLSFNGNKILTTGGGGMILTNDENIAKLAKHLSTQAKVPHPWEFNHDHIGFNYRLPNLNAALGCAQLESIESYIKIKRKIAQQYHTFFASTEIVSVKELPTVRSNYWLNVILLPSKEAKYLFLKETNDAKVMTRPAWKLMNELPMFQSAIKDDLSNSKWLEERLVNIPSSVIVNFS